MLVTKLKSKFFDTLDDMLGIRIQKSSSKNNNIGN